MNSENDRLLKETESKLRELRPRVQELRKLMIRAAAYFIARWYQGAVKECIIREPEKFKGMDMALAREMKIKVNELVKSAPQIAEEALSDERIWSVFSEDNTNTVYRPQLTPKHAIRLALSKIRPILKDYGFAIDNWSRPYWDKCESEPSDGYFSCSYLSNCEKPLTDHVALCPYMIEFSPELIELIQEYEKLLSTAQETLSGFYRAKIKRKNEELANMWDRLV